MPDDKKAEMFTDRRKFLLATTGGKRKAWKIRAPKSVEADTVYGLANTEHQLRVALGETFHVTKLSRDDLHAEMREELAKD